MRQVKISSVQYEMLMALGKRWRMKPEEPITELIEENYKSKSKRLKHLPPAGAFNICVDDRLDAKSYFSACIIWHQNILAPTSRT